MGPLIFCQGNGKHFSQKKLSVAGAVLDVLQIVGIDENGWALPYGKRMAQQATVSDKFCALIYSAVAKTISVR